MAAGPGERRLFVGGLGPSVTKDDLRVQLGRFGDVSSVELVSRMNEFGSPEKTFAYVNIKLSEDALGRCLRALDKSTWKGSQLRVQPARESFLHRLAQERLEARAEQELQPPDSGLQRTRGPALHMRAVPGTEVPGHKAELGREQIWEGLTSPSPSEPEQTEDILKYDPSKYCHNLKKFEQDVTNTVSVSDLTWKLEGGEDVMSKKRQGQFPPFRSHPTKRVKVEGDHWSPGRAAGCPELVAPAHPNTAQQLDMRKADSRPSKLPISASSTHKKHQKLQAGFSQTSESTIIRSKNSMSDDDIDSEEELKAMIAEEKKSQRRAFPETHSTEEDPFEVVDGDFKPSPTSSGMKAPCLDSAAHVSECDREYDSGDTDKIIAEGRNGDQSKDKPKISPKNKTKQKGDFLKTRVNCASSHQAPEMSKKKSSPGNKEESVNCTKHIIKKPSNIFPESEDGESEEELDYESMMTGYYRLNLTLADLEKLANKDAESPGGKATCAEWTLPKGQHTGSGQKTKKGPKNGARCIDPSDILASLLEGEEKIGDQNPPKENRSKSKFQAFRGVGGLYGRETPKRPFKNSGLTTQVKGQNSLEQEASFGSSMGKRASDSNACSSDEMSPPQNGKEAHGANGLPHCPGKLPRRRPASADQCCAVQSRFSSSECENASVSSLSSLSSKEPSSLYAKTCGADLGSDGGLGSPKMGGPKRERSDSITLRPSTGPEPKHEPEILKTHSKKPLKFSVKKDSASSRVQGKEPKGSQAREGERLPARTTPADAVGPHRNSEDNRKRLAALEERRRERELQKQLVRSALSSLDDRPASKPTHILFSSDSEEETEETESDKKPPPGSQVQRDVASKASGKLFESSESEDEGQETEDDETRFQIKPQFEGKAGKKLMSLQSHFGADDRFRMDARFLESESEEEEEELKEAEMAEEEELISEKKKNMEVIKSILPVGHQAPKPSKEEIAAKRFRNVVHYDPTRLDHATFERKVKPEEKESKAKRRKKREEAEKLPQVSKELYYSIAADLKERFRATEPAPGAGAAGRWNETPEETATAPGAPNPPADLGEFTFSFFGPDVSEAKEEPYKIETRASGRMAWQQDPRFQDSSSEEDEEEPEPAAGSQEVAEPEEVQASGKPISRFFFFSENDERLCVGPGSFWQGSGSLPSSEDWESRTLVLLQDCRKKHKAARRKAKP